MKRRKSWSITALDPDRTLYETGSREVWQSTLITRDGARIGPVIRQVIEPGMYTIRYFVVYDVSRNRHILIPSNTVVDISDREVRCSLGLAEILHMPAFTRVMNRSYETEVYQALGRTPHWIEEQWAAGSRDERDE